MKRLTDEEMDVMQNAAIKMYTGHDVTEYQVGYYTKSIAASNLIIIELLHRQIEGKK